MSKQNIAISANIYSRMLCVSGHLLLQTLSAP